MVRKRILVKGRVQGVSYRANTRDTARALGLVGWVRNQPDGSVELEVEGEAGDVERLVQWCHGGPVHAEVQSLEERELEPLLVEPDFVVRYRR